MVVSIVNDVVVCKFEVVTSDRVLSLVTRDMLGSLNREDIHQCAKESIWLQRTRQFNNNNKNNKKFM